MDDLERCYASGRRILRYRFNSTAELRRKLSAKGFDRQTIQSVLGRLQVERWLDDERFAAAFVPTRMLKRVGPMRIRRELIAAGVGDEIIGRALAENADAGADRLRALDLARRKFPILLRRNDVRVARNKLTAYLLKQGYDAALVREILDELSPRT